MKRLLIAASIAALMASGPALADKDKGKGKGPDKHRGPPHAAPHVPAPPRVVYDRARPDVRYDDRYDDRRHDNGRHLGHYKQWQRGQRIDVVYLEPRYYVRDYRTYRLAPPPRGYVWVRPYEEDNTYYLVQAASGLISQIFGR